jgi:hypothetical protein
MNRSPYHLGFSKQYLSDDYVSTFPDGVVLDKKGEIESVKSGTIAFMEIPVRCRCVFTARLR